MSVWDVVQGVGALAGITALTVQGGAAWKRRHVPRDIDGLRSVLDVTYNILLPVVSRPAGTPSLDMVADEAGNRTAIDLARYAGRLADPTLVRFLHEAGRDYMLAFALGTNLNMNPASRDPKLVSQQREVARRAMTAVESAIARLDEIERKLRR